MCSSGKPAHQFREKRACSRCFRISASVTGSFCSATLSHECHRNRHTHTPRTINDDARTSPLGIGAKSRANTPYCYHATLPTQVLVTYSVQISSRRGTTWLACPPHAAEGQAGLLPSQMGRSTVAIDVIGSIESVFLESIHWYSATQCCGYRSTESMDGCI